MAVEITSVRGHLIEPYRDALAALRIRVFRDWPYLYDGTLDYEREYLQHYIDADLGLMVLALDNGTLVGASSGLPMPAADAAFQSPFKSGQPTPAEIFYFGESVLEADYRGRGIGHQFFDQREAFARQSDFPFAAFCAVQRPADHPLRPVQSRALEPFWRARGYQPLDGKRREFNWTDVGERQTSIKPMQFWGKWL